MSSINSYNDVARDRILLNGHYLDPSTDICTGLCLIADLYISRRYQQLIFESE